MRFILKYVLAFICGSVLLLAQAETVAVYSGTGFAISTNKLATAAHVVENSLALVVVCPEFTEKAKVIYENGQKDVAIIQVKGNKFRDPIPVSKTIRSKIVVAIGFGGGQDGDTDISVGNYLYSIPIFHALSVKLIPGMSGGPTFDHYGNVIGINSRALVLPPFTSFVAKINDVIIKASTVKPQYTKTYEWKQLFTNHANEICVIYSYRNK